MFRRPSFDTQDSRLVGLAAQFNVMAGLLVLVACGFLYSAYDQQQSISPNGLLTRMLILAGCVCAAAAWYFRRRQVSVALWLEFEAGSDGDGDGGGD